MVGPALVVTVTIVAAASVAGILLRLRGKSTSKEQHHTGPTLVTKGEPLTTSNANQISIVSYNVLADAFVGSLTYADPELVAWSHRWPLLEGFLSSCNADIICMQEVDTFRLESYLTWAASAGYQAVVQEDKGGKAVLLVTLYRTSRLQLWWQDSRSRTLLAAFLFNDSTSASQALYVGNLHLEGSPRKPGERLSQARSALASLGRHQAVNGLPPADCHVLLAGDFNSGRHEGVGRLLSSGWLPAGYCEPQLPGLVLVEEEVQQPYLMREAYGDHPLPFTRKVPALESSLDFIYLTDTMQVVSLLWPLASTGPDKKLPGSRTGLPNQQHPSDHLPIGAVLECLPAAAHTH